MFSTSSTAYACPLPARCLAAAATPDGAGHRFLVGTDAPDGRNEVRALDFDDESNSFRVVGAVVHAAPVAALAARPDAPATYAACGAAADGGCAPFLYEGDAAAWDAGGDAAPDDADSSWHGSGSVEAVAPATKTALPARAGPCVGLAWADDRLAVATPRAVALVDVAAAADAASLVLDEAATALAWSPHDASECCVALRSGGVRLWDVRSKAAGLRIPEASGPALTTDYNPNKPFCLAAGGVDGRVRFYDARRGGAPLKILKAHAGWCHAVAYNRFHDQLVASAGADRAALLWRASSVSSAPLLDLDLGGDAPPGERPSEGSSSQAAPSTSAGAAAPDAADALVDAFEHRDAAAVAVAWSRGDAWVFASLSADGRVLLNHVPSAEKYKILL